MKYEDLKTETWKVMLFYRRKRARKFKMRGLATARCSALAIYDSTRMVIDRGGSFYIVQAPNAEIGREFIVHYRKSGNYKKPGKFLDWYTTKDYYKGEIVALGPKSIEAMAKSKEAIALWDSRIQTQGRVYWDQSRALKK